MKTYTVIANLKNGNAAFVANERKTKSQPLTTHFRYAFRMDSENIALEMVGRLNQVAAVGHCWKEVAFFSIGWRLCK